MLLSPMKHVQYQTPTLEQRGIGLGRATIESFRFSDENYEYQIFSQNNSERPQTSVILAGKTRYRRHFSTRFAKMSSCQNKSTRR